MSRAGVLIELNGRSTRLEGGATVADAVVATGADPDARGLAAAVDGEVVRRPEWHRLRLTEGQSVEVVRAVQGG
jgi:sulfur carrier protein